jgi:hypothetical protein
MARDRVKGKNQTPGQRTEEIAFVTPKVSVSG